MKRALFSGREHDEEMEREARAERFPVGPTRADLRLLALTCGPMLVARRVTVFAVGTSALCDPRAGEFLHTN